MRNDQNAEYAKYVDATRRLASVISGPLAGTCIVFMAAMLSLDPRSLDVSLQHSLVAFAIALPILLLSFMLAYLRVAGVFAYFLSWAGEVSVGYGIYEVLFHSNQLASQAFALAALACNVMFINIGSLVIRRSRR